jgi:hypothetical protein
LREINASDEAREEWEAVLRLAVEVGKMREKGEREAAPCSSRSVDRTYIVRMQHAIRCYAGWLLQEEVSLGKMICERVKPVGVQQQLVLTLRVKGTMIKGLKLVLWDAPLCEGLDRKEERVGQDSIYYETGLVAISHHGSEEVCGWVSSASDAHIPDMTRPSLISLRHLEDEKPSPLWPGIRWLCLNLLAWQVESYTLYPEDSGAGCKSIVNRGCAM